MFCVFEIAYTYTDCVALSTKAAKPKSDGQQCIIIIINQSYQSGAFPVDLTGTDKRRGILGDGGFGNGQKQWREKRSTDRREELQCGEPDRCFFLFFDFDK